MSEVPKSKLKKMGAAISSLHRNIDLLRRMKEEEDALIYLRMRANPRKSERRIRAECKRERDKVRENIRKAYEEAVMWSEECGIKFDYPIDKILENDKD